MPNKSLGPVVKARALRLFKAMLSFAKGELDDCEHLDLRYDWKDLDSGRPRLVVETKLRVLEVLTAKDHDGGKLTKAHIREALHRMQDFIEILVDNRSQPRGKELWNFTLKLWSTDLQRNLDLFDREWEGRRSPKSKLLEATATAPTLQDKATGLKPGVPFLAPPLPSHFVERPDVSGQLKACLFSQDTAQTGVLVVSAIYGLGGIGKSTLAAALARDPDVLNQFRDGVFWATLGQQPDLLSFLSCWILELRDFDFKPTTPQAASLHLRTLLIEKRALLVVDDVWCPEHFEFFRVGGAGCRVLVTTREAPIRGANRYDLDVMKSDQALELLRLSINGNLTEADLLLARCLAATVGYLPLALELAAMQVYHYGVSWRELLADLNREIAYLEALDLPGADTIESESVRKGYSLLASFNLSLRRLKPKQLVWFGWLGVLPEDVSLTPALMMTVWQLDAGVAGKTLRDFKSKALLLSGSPLADNTPTYRLHDLLHDLARGLLTGTGSGSNDRLPGLGLTLPEAHAQLLERYRAKTERGLWHTLRDDGYIHAHLSWHLVKADRVEELHQLLQEETDAGRNGWYEACESMALLGVFVKDVARAWEQADGAFESEPSRAISLQCRYALIMSSLNSLAKNIPAKLMAALVEHGVWTPAQGLAYARQAQNPSDRGKALRELAPHLPESLLPEALDTARAFQSEFYQAYTLSALAPHLPENLLPIALATARAIQSDDERAEVLSALAVHFPEILPEALDTTARAQYWSRAKALCALAARFPEILPEALDAAVFLSESGRAKVLSGLAAHFPEILPEALDTARAAMHEDEDFKYEIDEVLSDLVAHLPELLPEALDTAWEIPDEYCRAKALCALAAHFPEILPIALDTTREVPDESDRADALITLAAHFPEILTEALYAAWEIPDIYLQLDALSTLAAHLPEILPQTLDSAREIQDGSSQVKALGALVAHLPETLLPIVLDTVREISDDYWGWRFDALSALAVYLPEILPEALDAARAIKNRIMRANALSALAAYLPEILPEALDAARAIQDESSRAKALSALAAYLPEILPEALDTVRAIPDEGSRARQLGDLAAHLPEILLQEALDTARDISDELDRAKALSALAAYLPEILPEALDTARNLPNNWRRVHALRYLAAHLPENLLPIALDTARDIPDESDRVKALIPLAAHLPEILPEALDTARAIIYEGSRAEALTDIAKHLPEILPEALDTVRAIQDESSRAYELQNLAAHLPENLLLEALDTARKIQELYHRAQAFSKIALELKRLPANFFLWQETLHILVYYNRYSVLDALAELVPVIIELGGTESLPEIARAIVDVGRQWP